MCECRLYAPRLQMKNDKKSHSPKSHIVGRNRQNVIVFGLKEREKKWLQPFGSSGPRRVLQLGPWQSDYNDTNQLGHKATEVRVYVMIDGVATASSFSTTITAS